jgi:hypothetical protein
MSSQSTLDKLFAAAGRKRDTVSSPSRGITSPAHASVTFSVGSPESAPPPATPAGAHPPGILRFTASPQDSESPVNSPLRRKTKKKKQPQGPSKKAAPQVPSKKAAAKQSMKPAPSKKPAAATAPAHPVPTKNLPPLQYKGYVGGHINVGTCEQLNVVHVPESPRCKRHTNPSLR